MSNHGKVQLFEEYYVTPLDAEISRLKKAWDSLSEARRLGSVLTQLMNQRDEMRKYLQKVENCTKNQSFSSLGKHHFDRNPNYTLHELRVGQTYRGLFLPLV